VSRHLSGYRKGWRYSALKTVMRMKILYSINKFLLREEEQIKMKTKRKHIIALLAVAALGLTACQGRTPAEDLEEEKGEAELPSYEPVLYEDLTSRIISMGNYKGLEAVRTIKEVTDEDVRDEADRMKKECTDLVTVDREAQKGDVVLIDFTGYVDGETLDELSGREHSLEIGSGEFVPGFEEQLIGARADTNVEVNVTFPDDYYEEMAGKAARFEVYVQSVQEYNMEDWGDDFIKEKLGYDNETDMLAAVRKEMETDAEAEADENLEYDLVAALLGTCQIEIQEADIKLYSDQMMSEYETYASIYGKDLDTFLGSYMGTTKEQLMQVFRETASFRVQMTLVFHEIAEKEGLQVSEKEYQERLGRVAADYGYEDTSDVEAVYSRAMMEEELIQEKVINLIRDHAVIS